MPAFQPVDSLLNAWTLNARVNAYLMANTTDEAWRALPPGGKGRDVASIFGHMHNVRLMWLKSIDKNAALPAKLEGATYAKSDVAAALNESSQGLAAALRHALSTNNR